MWFLMVGLRVIGLGVGACFVAAALALNFGAWASIGAWLAGCDDPAAVGRLVGVWSAVLLLCAFGVLFVVQIVRGFAQGLKGGANA